MRERAALTPAGRRAAIALASARSPPPPSRRPLKPAPMEPKRAEGVDEDDREAWGQRTAGRGGFLGRGWWWVRAELQTLSECCRESWGIL